MPIGAPPTRLRLVESRQNSRVKELRAALARGARTPTGLIAIEGEHLVTEAVRSGLRFSAIFLREGYTPRSGLPEDVDQLLLPPDVFASAVATEQPQGIAALVQPPIFSADDLFRGTASLVLVLAGLQDPGNVGTLLRSAEAFGATGILTLPGTASPWSPKTLRASAGSAFRVPMHRASEGEALGLLTVHSVPAVAAVARDGVPVSEARLDGPVALFLGNEGAGLEDALLAAASHRVTIPMPGAVESLNAAVAGSLLLYEVARQRASRQPQPRVESAALGDIVQRDLAPAGPRNPKRGSKIR